MNVGSYELGISYIHKRFGTRPSQYENIPGGCTERDVGIRSLALDIPVAEHADEDGRVQVRGVHHVDVSGGVVEVLQLLRK